MKKALSVLLAMALIFSLCNPVFAASSVVSSGSKTTHKYDLNNQNELNEYIRLYGNKAQNSKAAIASAARTISPAPSADTLLQLAESQVGVSGRPNEYTWWFGSIDGTYSYAWCHAFISWVAEKCGAADIIPKTVSCMDGVKWFKDRGRWHPSGVGYTPMKGDVVYFDWDANGTYDHVGFVALESNAILYTIEGNSNDAVRKKSYSLYSKEILGYGSPQYSESSIEIPVVVPSSCSCSRSYEGLYTCTSVSTPLKIRSGHGTQYSILGTISPGAPDIIVTAGNGAWAHVSYKGISGYCSLSYLKKQQTTTNTGNTSNTNCGCSSSYAGMYTCTSVSTPLKIRSGHGTQYSILGSISPGAKDITVTAGNGAWAHVSYKGISGYCSLSYLKKQQTATNTGNTSNTNNINCSCSSSYAGMYTCTSVSTPLKIRSGHGTQYSILGTISPGAKDITVTAGNGAWAHVSYKGISGYCSLSYLKKQQTTTNTGNTTNTNNTNCSCSSSYAGMYTCTSVSTPLKIRSGHGTQYSILGSISPGAKDITVTAGNGAWAHVSYQGISGYCSLSYLKKQQTSTNTTYNCGCSSSYAGKYTCTSISTPLKIRSGHGTQYSILGSIPPGTPNITVIAGNGAWAHVRYGNVEGYCSMSYLRR